MDKFYSIKESTLTAIGDAIREKTGTTAMLNPEGEMPEAIRRISTEFTIERIEITTPPDKTEYYVDDAFDPTGMVVVGYYSDGSSEECFGYEYSTDGLEIDDTEVTISFTWRGITVTTTQSIVVTDPGTAYGVEWDGTATTKWSRTGLSRDFTDPVPYVIGATECSSPFDDIYPWKGMVRVTDEVAGELVAIPKFWFKWTQNGTALKLEISPVETDGFHVSPAHADRGDGYGERDVVYIGRYPCNSDYKSVTGAAPKTSISRGVARDNISALGDEYWQYDIALHWTIRMLYLVEFADWNSQAVIGLGGSSGNTGLSDDMPYHTGSPTTSVDAYSAGVQYRHIEGLWSNVLYWCDGVWYSGTNVYCVTNPQEFSDAAVGTVVGAEILGNMESYIKNYNVATISGFEYMLLVAGVNGSAKSYICDHIAQNATSNILCCGGVSTGSHIGLFYQGRSIGSANTIVGCRLMKLPNPS